MHPRTARRSVVVRLAALWQAYWWVAPAVLGGVALALGYLGFREYFDGAGDTRSTSDLVYLSLQLFTLESGSVPQTGAPWQLEVARLAAPAASATALMAALAAVFRQQIQEWRLRRERGHVVVCGVGDSGSQLAAELRDAGRGVVAIEIDGQNQALDGLRRRGVAVVIGDGRDSETLRRARLDRASHLVCLTGSDDTNAEVTLQATELVVGRRGSALNCLVQIRDPALSALMRSEELASPHRRGARLDFFNVDEQGARAMIRDHSPFSARRQGSGAPSVLVVGLSRLGQSLVAELARQSRIQPAADEHPIQITVIDPNATEIVEGLRRRHPLLAHGTRLVTIEAALDPLDIDAIEPCAASIAYVCMGGASGAVQAALQVQHLLPGPDAAVVVELVHANGMARVIDRPEGSRRIWAFNVLERTMRCDVLLGGTYELLARAIHDEYLESQRQEGSTAATNPSLVPWEELPASLKESNRDQADHIGTKLAAIGRGVVPLTDWDADRNTRFSHEEIELLAEMEHERWVEQRRLDGWTPGPKDIGAKHTPYLVPWSALSEEVKEWDRQAVRGIPSFLARAGYQIISSSA